MTKVCSICNADNNVLNCYVFTINYCQCVELLKLHVILSSCIKCNCGCTLSNNCVKAFCTPCPVKSLTVITVCYYTVVLSICTDCDINLNKVHIPRTVITDTVCISINMSCCRSNYYATSTKCILCTYGFTLSNVSMLLKNCSHRGLHCGPVLTVRSCVCRILINLTVNLYPVTKSKLDFPRCMRNTFFVLRQSEVECFTCTVIDKEYTVLLVKNFNDCTYNIVAT